ncbi:glycosyltransferase [Bosea thiooxidans]
MPIDLTVILNAHNEDVYITRTLISIEEAAVFAANLGISLELVIVLDRPTPKICEITAKAQPQGFKRKQVIQVDNGSLGLSRNDGAAAATGEWLFLQDADDLISYNGLAGLFFSAQRHGPHSIHVCDTLVAFGLDPHIASYFDSDVITPIPFFNAHPFVSRICCHRSLIAQQPFVDLRLTRGYAYEDWFFNSEALAKGYTFHSAPETIFFYRQRANGLLRQANTISARQIPPSKLFEPAKFLRLAAEGYARFKSDPNWRDRLVPQQTDVNNPVIFDLFLAANRIEPQINWMQFVNSPKYNNLSFSDVCVGVAYYELCQLIGVTEFDDVFLLPFLGAGGAERYLLDIINELNAAGATRNVLVFLGQSGHVSNWVSRLPPNVTVVDFQVLCPDLGEDARILLTLKAVEACASRARLHLKPSPYAHAFAHRYLHLLKDCTRIYYRFTDARTFVHGQQIGDPYGFEFVSTLIDEIDIVVADNQLVIDEDRRRLGIREELWHRLYARQVARLEAKQVAERVEQAAPAIAWAGRLDHQKRPDLLPLIASRLYDRQPELTLHIYGKPVLNSFSSEALAAHPNVRLHGEFVRFEEVLAVKPMCFLFTSFFEGVPIVLLEAAASGLPIIAPDVGGVAEVVQNGESGTLLPSLADDDAMADAIADAIMDYANNPLLREQLAAKALERLVKRNGAQAYTSCVSEIFLRKNG